MNHDELIEKHGANIIEMYFCNSTDVISIAKFLGLTTDFVSTIIRVEYNQIMQLKRDRLRGLHKRLDTEETTINLPSLSF